MYWPIGIPNRYSPAKLGRRTHDNTDDTGQRLSTDIGIREDVPDGAAVGEQKNSRDGTQGRGQQGAAQAVPATEERILDMKASRGGHMFATITDSTLSIWQAKPMVLLATAARSKQSLSSYGKNVALVVRADALIIVLQTSGSFLITYSLASDPNSQVYNLLVRSTHRRQSVEGLRRSSSLGGTDYGPGDGSGCRDISLKFRMVIRIDAGICKAIALEDELMVATYDPAAIQCIRWLPDKSGSSHGTELLSRMPWFAEGATVTDIVYDRPMGLLVWAADDGKAYAVQRTQSKSKSTSSSFNGYCFHDAQTEGSHAISIAVNARFSLIAVGCADATVKVYTAKDYLGNIPLSHTLSVPVSHATSGNLCSISHSPDGHCTFVAFEKGWAMWSVYGKLGANSFLTDDYPPSDRWWLNGMLTTFWTGGGASLVFLGIDSPELGTMTMARCAITGCFDMANIQRSLLQTGDSLMVSRGALADDAPSLADKTAQWQTVRLPSSYMSRQWPIRAAVISPDGKYLAAAGRRGLVHHSTASGRWKMFEDLYAEEEFTVKGGLCWYQHILVAAVETYEGSHEVRLYSREKPLTSSNTLHVETLQQGVICMTLTDGSSLLVYTQENILIHYILSATASSIKLVQVGQIGFHGIIRAPARVRSINWNVPDEQREHGDISQDVAKATVVFLIDGKLVLLQPSPEEKRELRYDMRVIAHDVEYYLLAREGLAPQVSSAQGQMDQEGGDELVDSGSRLHDSLWYFNGKELNVWPDVHELLATISSELHPLALPPVAIPTDFYPVTAVISSGVLAGMEPSLIQKRDVDMSYFRIDSRTHLFIPALIRHYLSRFDSPAALHLTNSYKRLSYLPHALEILLHNVLDDEVDASPPAGAVDERSAEHESELASLLTFLSSSPSYLEIILNVTRKTELRSWSTLFRRLPPVVDLFERALEKDDLETAAGLLLVLHTFDPDRFTPVLMGWLLRGIKRKDAWEIGGELARFLVGVDHSGRLLRQSLEEGDLGVGC